MTTDGTGFGRQISKARKAKALSQKELAAKIMKEEDGTAISPQYLNDIEHDRSSPTSDHLIRQFAELLNIEDGDQIGRGHVCTPVTNAHIVCSIPCQKKNKTQ